MTLLLLVETLANNAEGHPDGEPPDEPPNGGGAAKRREETHLRDPPSCDRRRGGPTLLREVVRQVMPCRPGGQSAVGIVVPKDTIEPDEHAVSGFRLTNGVCESFAGEHNQPRLVGDMLTSSAPAKSRQKSKCAMSWSAITTPREQHDEREAGERQRAEGEGEGDHVWSCAA